ncbi:MAG: DotU family type IV/VI secretion system protein [Acidobacteria bacterium]|nr:DotU family type IV/VI secretion system protein [Acidobacteriota bacterium]
MQPYAANTAPAAFGSERRAENLAWCFQEVFTVVERMRSNRQPVTDANVFRHQVREAIKMADQESKKRGYDGEEIKLAIFAVIAFLDESILNLRLPVFADWPRQPMQEEYFGHHVAGEIFFQHLQKLLTMNDSQSLADLLEVFQLCLLLGFMGRYSLGSRGDLQPILQATADKIHRIRRTNVAISPCGMLPPAGATSPTGNDPWVKRVAIIAIACLLLTAGLFGTYYYMLSNGISSLASLARGR